MTRCQTPLHHDIMQYTDTPQPEADYRVGSYMFKQIQNALRTVVARTQPGHA